MWLRLKITFAYLRGSPHIVVVWIRLVYNAQPSRARELCINHMCQNDLPFRLLDECLSLVVIDDDGWVPGLAVCEDPSGSSVVVGRVREHQHVATEVIELPSGIIWCWMTPR